MFNYLRSQIFVVEYEEKEDILMRKAIYMVSASCMMFQSLWGSSDMPDVCEPSRRAQQTNNENTAKGNALVRDIKDQAQENVKQVCTPFRDKHENILKEYQEKIRELTKENCNRTLILDGIDRILNKYRKLDEQTEKESISWGAENGAEVRRISAQNLLIMQELKNNPRNVNICSVDMKYEMLGKTIFFPSFPYLETTS